jgi:hypothetical protein
LRPLPLPPIGNFLSVRVGTLWVCRSVMESLGIAGCGTNQVCRGSAKPRLARRGKERCLRSSTSLMWEDAGRVKRSRVFHWYACACIGRMRNEDRRPWNAESPILVHEWLRAARCLIHSPGHTVRFSPLSSEGRGEPETTASTGPCIRTARAASRAGWAARTSATGRNTPYMSMRQSRENPGAKPGFFLGFCAPNRVESRSKPGARQVLTCHFTCHRLPKW